MKDNALYLSGKITGLPTRRYRDKFTTAQRKYERQGFKVINPVNVRPFLGLSNWICYMIADVRQLLNCRAIVLLHDWHDSRGARIEVAIAILTRKVIIVDRALPEKRIDKSLLELINEIAFKQVIECVNTERRLQK